MKIEIEIEDYPQIRHALATLELERSRLLKSIRTLRLGLAKGENAAAHIELRIRLDETKTAISLIRCLLEAARQARQREYPMPEGSPGNRWAKSPKHRQRKRAEKQATDDQKKPASS